MSLRPPRILIQTLGCKVNQADAQQLAASLARRGLEVVGTDTADVVVVNTCVVTATAEAKCRQALRGLARRFPQARVYAIGCGTRRPDLTIGQLPGITVLVGTDPEQLAADIAGRLDADGPALSAPRNRTRALLNVQTGCSSHCSYCIVPSVRGRPRSLPPSRVIATARALADEGYKEIVMCGTNLGTYGRDLTPPVTLAGLIRQLPMGPGLRYRLSSLEPLDTEPELVQMIAASPGVCRHLHLVLQSGSPRVLAEMGRQGSLARVRSLVAIAREADPRCAITTDLIAGFPGESEHDHRQSLDAIAEFEFSRVHVFPFSVRPGTRAATMPGQLPQRVRAERAQQLARAGTAQAARFIDRQLGTSCQVLIERDDGRGLSDHYLRVTINGWQGPANVLATALLVERRGTDVFGAVGQG